MDRCNRCKDNVKDQCGEFLWPGYPDGGDVYVDYDAEL